MAKKAVVFCGAKPGKTALFGEKAAGKCLKFSGIVEEWNISPPRDGDVSSCGRCGGGVWRQSLWLHGATS